MKNIVDFVKEELIKKVPNARLLFLTLRGSRAYGTNNEKSDYDYAGIFIQSIDDILTSNLVETIHISDSDDDIDVVMYGIQKFMNLLSNGNPNIIELLYTDDVIYTHDALNGLLSHRDDFITKNIKNSFLGYANAQIHKAKGLNKKINWENENVRRKDILDFVYVVVEGKSLKIRDYHNYLLKNGKTRDTFEQFIKGISIKKMQNIRDLYAAYPSIDAKGIVKIDMDDNVVSTELHLSEIQKEEENQPRFMLSYNQDAFTQHCIKYKEYKDWLEHKNDSRYVKADDQYIDGKNMMHCIRLLNMAKEVAEGKGVIVKRPDADYLLSIRYGKHNYKEMMDDVDNKFKEIKKLFDESDLKNSISVKLKNDILIDIINHFYDIKIK